MLRPDRPQSLPPAQLPMVAFQAGSSPSGDLSRSPILPAGGQRLVQPVSGGDLRQLHYLTGVPLGCRPIVSQQQLPGGGQAGLPDVPPIFPQQVKDAQLLQRRPALHPLNAGRDGPVAVADQMSGWRRPGLLGQLQGRRPRPESHQDRPGFVPDYLQFLSAMPGAHPQTIQFPHRLRQSGPGQGQPPQPATQGVFDPTPLPPNPLGSNSNPAPPGSKPGLEFF